jgi:hypothetical protein
VFRPQPSDGKAILCAEGSNWWTGLSNHYDSKFPEELQGKLDFHTFNRILKDINDIAEDYWPCCTAETLAVVLCPLSLGMSCFLPMSCINECEGYLNEKIEISNSRYLKPKGLELRLVKKIFRTSWLEIHWTHTNSKLQLDQDSVEKKVGSYETEFLNECSIKMHETELTSCSTENSKRAILSNSEGEPSLDYEEGFDIQEILTSSDF